MPDNYSVSHCKADIDEKIITREDESAEDAFKEHIKDEAGYYAKDACKEIAKGFERYEEAEKSEAYLDPPPEKNVCNCIDAVLVALASAEAMEHNTIVSKEARSIGIDAQRLLSKDDYEDLTFEHDWLEYPIKEPMAGLAFHLAMRDIKDKCGVETKHLVESFNEANKNLEEKHFTEAQTKFINIKTEILNIAQDLCKND